MERTCSDLDEEAGRAHSAGERPNPKRPMQNRIVPLSQSLRFLFHFFPPLPARPASSRKSGSGLSDPPDGDLTQKSCNVE